MVQHALSPAYNEFDYTDHLLPAITSRLSLHQIIDYNVKKFGYHEHPLITNTFSCILFTRYVKPCSHVTFFKKWPVFL